jgi:hypothetical protein
VTGAAARARGARGVTVVGAGVAARTALENEGEVATTTGAALYNPHLAPFHNPSI